MKGLDHVGFLSPSWPAGKVPNGIITYTDHISEALTRRGTRVTVFAMRTHQKADGFVSVPDFAAGRWTDRVASWATPNWFELKRPARSITKAVMSSTFAERVQLFEMEETFGWAKLVADSLPLPVVVRLHGPWILAGVGAGLENASDYEDRVSKEGQAIEAAAGITSPTRFVLEAVRKYYSLPLEKAIVVPYPQPSAYDSDCWKPEQADADTILFVGRFDRVKGGDLILEAYRLLEQTRPNIRLVFIGPDRGFLDENGRQWSMKERMHDVLGSAADKVDWLGELPREEVNPYRRKAAVVVVPSRSEPFGYTAVEALTLRCPLVVSDAGGLPEIVEDGVNGLIFPSGDASALAQCLQRLLDDREFAIGLGMRGRRDVAERYDPDTIATQIAEYHLDCHERTSTTIRS